MGWWAKSVILFNALREYGQQSIWSLAERTGLCKSSVHRQRRFVFPKSENIRPESAAASRPRRYG